MNNDSTLIPVYSTPKGVVYKCSCCDQFQVTFENIVFHQDQERFREFKDILADLLEKTEEPKSTPHITMRFWPGELALKLSKTEIMCLHRLFEGAYTMLELDQILGEQQIVQNRHKR